MTTTNFVCSKCGATTTDAAADGWLISSRKNKPGQMVIRCPEHVTVYAAAAVLGSSTSPAKAEAARRNASLPPKPGNRPRGRPRKQPA